MPLSRKSILLSWAWVLEELALRGVSPMPFAWKKLVSLSSRS